MLQKKSAKRPLIESVDRIEPARLETAPEAISDAVAELSAAAAKLESALHPTTAANLADVVRIMNTYYSNLIEGHNTRPRDIARALDGKFDKDKKRRNLQLEAAAHAGFGVPAIIADFAFHAGFVLGEPVHDWRRLDLAAVHGETRVNGKVVGEGLGRDVMGHPLASLAWLANRLGAIGKKLEPGQIVLTGSLPLPYWAKPGAAVEIVLDPLGTVALSIV